MTMFGSQWLANAGGGYEIDQSIRFNDDDSAHLARDGFGQSPTSSTVCTISVWVKRGNNLGSNSAIIYGGDPSGSTSESLRFGTGNQLQFSQASSDYDLKTTQLFRDVGAWYHIVVVLNTGAAESSRAALYVNGSQVTDFATENYPGSSYSTNFTANSSSVEHVIGSNAAAGNASQFFDGYIAEFNFIDGQALTPASFGETNADGVWVPKAYSGSYGNNGFFIDGRDSSDLGDDESGNGNDLTASGLAAADSVLDSPTNNMPTLNPLSSGTGTLSDGNLQYVGVSGNWSNSRLNLLVPDTGKWAIRCKTTTSYDQMLIGLCAPDSASPYTDIDVNGIAQIRYNAKDGNFVTRVGGSLVRDTGPATTSAQTFIQLLFDMDNGKMGIAADGATSGTFADISTYSALDLNGDLSAARQPFVQAYAGTDSGAGVIIDAGQSGWTTTVTGFKNLILANLATPTIADGSEYFHTQTYTGNGSSGLAVTNDANAGDFQPDLLIIAPRSNGDNKVWFDDVRGTTNRIRSNSADPADVDGTALVTFETDGFDIDSTDVNFNGSGRTYAAWQWIENATPGFDMVQYTGNATNRTISHSLGVAPEWIVIKDTSNTESWVVGHNSIGWTKNLFLNLTNAEASSSTIWQDTAPTSSVFSIGTSDGVNKSSGAHIAYLWASVDGFSKFSSYTGNGDADGPFVTTGFKPSWLMVKRASGGTGNWDILDNKREPFNVMDAVLDMDNSTSETTYSTLKIDFLSNGFKVRGTQSNINSSGDTYVYMAFAEHPFGGEDITPATAR